MNYTPDCGPENEFLVADNFTQKMEIEHTPEWQVIFTNDRNIIGERTILKMVDLIVRKTQFGKKFVIDHVMSRLREDK